MKPVLVWVIEEGRKTAAVNFGRSVRPVNLSLKKCPIAGK